MFSVSSDYKDVQAVVFGLFETGLGVIRSLGQKGIPVIGVDCKKDVAWYSRYSRSLLCPHPLQEEEEFVNWVEQSFSNYSYKMPVFFTSDDFLSAFSKQRGIFSKYFVYNLAEHSLLLQISNKYQQHLLAKKAGIETPKTLCLHLPGDVNNMALDNISFPAFIKGLDVKSWRSIISSSIKGYKLDSIDILKIKTKEILEKEVPVVIQEIIQGPDTNHYKYCSYINTAGKVLAEFTLQKLRQNPIHFGIGSVVESVYNEELIEEGRKLFSKIDYKGVGSAEFKKDNRDGKLKLIEINPRYWQQNYLTTACGLNMAYINYCDLMQQPNCYSNSFRTGVKWVNIYSDFKSCWNYRKEGSLTFKNWRTSLRGSRVYADFTWDDPVPAFFGGWANFGKLAGLLRN